MVVRERDAEELRLAEGGFSRFFLAAAGAFLQEVGGRTPFASRTKCVEV